MIKKHTTGAKENFFFAGYIIFLVGVMLNISTYNEVMYAKYLAYILQIFGCLIEMIKIFIFDIYPLKEKKINIDYKLIIFFVLMVISFFITKSKDIVYFAVFIIAAKEIDFKKIAKTTLITQIIMLLFIILSNQFNIINSINVYREMSQRKSLGSSSPNCLMLQIFQIVSLYCYVKKRTIKWYEIIILFGISLIFYNITDSRMGMIAIIFILIGVSLYKNKIIQFILNKMKFFIKYLPIIFSIIFLTLTLLYRPLKLDKLNIAFSDRLRLTSNAIDDYGVNLLGNDIEWIGQKSKSEDESLKYNYVDSSYMNILLNQGLIFFIFILYSITKQNEKAYSSQDYYLVIVLLIIQSYCFFDSFLMSIGFNTFLFLLKDIIYPIKIKDENNLKIN